MLFMKSQSHLWPFFRSHYLIKNSISSKKRKKKRNGESIGIWNQCFLFIYLFYFIIKKTLNWTHDTKLDSNWNPI